MNDPQQKVPTKSEVKALLQAAFHGTHMKSGLRPASHEECVEMRTGIISLSNTDLPFALREVLEDLLETHATDDRFADVVIDFLDILCGATNYEGIEEVFGEQRSLDAIETDALLKHEKSQAVADFSRDQAVAIQKWLEHARTWPEMGLHRGSIDTALLYWKNRSQRTK